MMIEATVVRGKLRSALSVLERIVPTRTTNSVLMAARLVVADGTLELAGTNLGVSVRQTLPAETPMGTERTVLAVPAHVLGQACRGLPGELVKLEYDTGRSVLKLSSGGSFIELETVDTEALPPYDWGRGERFACTVVANEFHAALSTVKYAASANAFNSYFRGIRIELGLSDEAEGQCVASDGYVLALHTFTLATLEHGEPRALLLPVRAVDELLPLLAGEGELYLSMADEVTLVVESDSMSTYVKLLENKFADYKAVIPTQPLYELHSEAQALKDSTERARILSSRERSHRTVLTMEGSKTEIHVENEYGSMRDALSSTLSGPNAEAANQYTLNAQFLADALAGHSGEVTLTVEQPTRALMLTSTGNPRYRSLISPVSQ